MAPPRGRRTRRARDRGDPQTARLELPRRPEQSGQNHRGQADRQADDPAGDVLAHQHGAQVTAMPMIPPVATTRMAPRSTFKRRRSRPGTMPWGRSGRPASRAPDSGSERLGGVSAVASRGSAAVGRSFDAGRSPDSEEEVTPRTVLPRRSPASRLDVQRRFAASGCPLASQKALERPRGGGTLWAPLTASRRAPRAGRVSPRGASAGSGRRRTAVRPRERGIAHRRLSRRNGGG